MNDTVSSVDLKYTVATRGEGLLYDQEDQMKWPVAINACTSTYITLIPFVPSF